MLKKGKKKDTLTSHKKKAWTQFSLFIRTRDCLRTMESPYEGLCITCGRLYPIKLLQAGHFIDGRNNAVLFSEQGVHAQCYACNVRLHGNKVKYWLFMEEHYSREIIDKLIKESENEVIYKKFDYDDIAESYREKTVKLLRDPTLAVLRTEE